MCVSEVQTNRKSASGGGAGRGLNRSTHADVCDRRGTESHSVCLCVCGQSSVCVCVCALCWQYSERLSQKQISEVNPGEGDKTHIVSQDNTPGSVTEKEREGDYGVMS